MRILIHCLNFAPELVGCGKTTGEMADWLAGRGPEVRVVTAPPFNPEWKVALGFSPWRYSRSHYVRQSQPQTRVSELAFARAAARSRGASEAGILLADPPDSMAETTIVEVMTDEATPGELTAGEVTTGGLTVLRCPLWVPLQPSALKRTLHLASFALASLPAMLGQIRWKPEVVMVMEPTLFCLPAALLTGRLCGAKTWLHVLDFELDAGFELGLLKSRAQRRAAGWVEEKSMSAFDRVSTISEKMLARLLQKGVAPSACLLFPNWVDTDAIFPIQKPSPFRAELGISANEIVALYAGTMARKQGLEVLAEAACRLVGREGLRFVFCGEGPGKTMLAGLTCQLTNVQWIPLQPFERLNDLLNLADIHLLPQKADAADLVMPSKLTGMLASGRPVVATSRPGTQLAQAVEDRGMVVEPGDAAALAAAIEQLAAAPNLRQRLGRNAREYALSALEKERVLSQFEREMLAFAAAS
jgi:colanic acid biosynthesis glycosyl transferase WcaI